MISLFLKKNFYDGWDNFVWIVVFNLFFIAIEVMGIYGLRVLTSISIIYSVLLVLFLSYMAVLLLFGVSASCASIVDHKTASYKIVFSTIKKVWRDAILFSVLFACITIIVVVGVPFYFTSGTMIGYVLSFLMVWVAFLIVLGLQWFFPLYSQLEGNFKKTLKKSFILLFDNTGFSFFLFFYTILLFVFSVIFIFLAPSIVGVCMAQNNALKLRMYKYDWLENEPDVVQKQTRKHIPWTELLFDEKEFVGNRTLKNLFFPWKD